MHRRTKATAIPKKVKETVYKRDNGCCIFCGAPGLPEAHVVARSHGGLGIETNIITACRACHDHMDNSSERGNYVKAAEDYLSGIYDNWKREDQIYNKWGNHDTEGKSN